MFKPDAINQKPDLKEEEVTVVESTPDVLSEAGEELGREAKPDRPEGKREAANEINRLKNEIAGALTPEQPVGAGPEDARLREERIEEYQDRYLPDHLYKKPGLVSRAMKGVVGLMERGTKTEGAENIPEGACLVICNHFGGGDAGMGDSAAILDNFKEKNVHLGIGRNIWWDKSPVLGWVFKKIGGIPVSESLSNLSDEQKQEVLGCQKGSAKKIYGGIVESEKQGKIASNVDFVRQSVAALSRGDAVSFYPEGLWLHPEGPKRERQELKQGYRGIELIASQYKKLTGKELKIVPTAFVEDRKTGDKKFKIGESLVLSENESGKNDTDWCMSHVAAMLPEEQRGYYRGMVSGE